MSEQEDFERERELFHRACLLSPEERDDFLEETCRHDPTLRQKLPAMQDTPPRYVVWGEGTTDEMCLAILVNG